MRNNIIYAVLTPTPKGVGYDLNVHFTCFRNLKFIAFPETADAVGGGLIVAL